MYKISKAENNDFNLIVEIGKTLYLYTTMLMI